MSAPLAASTERYDPYAGQSERRDAARTFVTTTDRGTVTGYYTLVAGQLNHREATTATRKGLSRHFPIPVVVNAIDDQAATFYERYGFRALAATPRTLMVTVAEIREAASD